MTLPAVTIPKVPVTSIGGRLLYALQPKQYQVYCQTPLKRPTGPYHQHLGCGGAAGGGKSYLSRSILTNVALHWPGSSAIIFRRTEGEIKANHVNKFRAEVPDELDGRRLYTWNGADLVATWFNGSRTYFGYLRQDDDVYTYQGPEYDVMIFEEATQYSDFQVRWLTGNRLRATVPMSRPFALYPSNPGGKGHFWYKRLFVDRRYHEEEGEHAQDYWFLQMFLRDNHELVRRDPAYIERLNKLPEPWRSWQRDGNFEAGAGTAFADLNRNVHLVQRFEIPPHWSRFGGFDWGFRHPWAFGEYATNEDGKIFKLDSYSARLQQDRVIAQTILESVQDARCLGFVAAGHDCWADIKSRGEHGPTTAELFLESQIILVQANISRVAGYKQLRTVLDPKQAGGPQFVWFDTAGNRRCLEQFAERVADEDNLEDVLKTDADDWGEGGDDYYDETRYAIMSRARKATPPEDTEPLNAWSPETLQAEHDRLYRGRGDAMVKRPVIEDPDFPEFM